jgi:hypothetical protein
MSNVELEFNTDRAGSISKGCAAYLQGKLAYLKWPKEWFGTDSLRDMISEKLHEITHQQSYYSLNKCVLL